MIGPGPRLYSAFPALLEKHATVLPTLVSHRAEERVTAINELFF